MLPPYWNVTGSLPHFPRLEQDTHTDVVVIGGGITGLTAAYLLKRAGRRVVVVERGRLAAIDTASTTAHLTAMPDLRTTDLVSTFGKDHARAAWDAGFAAIGQIAECIEAEGIDCHFAWVPAYLHAPVGEPVDDDTVAELKTEAEHAADLGFDVRFVDRTPFFDRPAVEIDHQARFHPAAYLRKLVEVVNGDGSAIYEQTPASDVENDPLTVVAGGHRITCDYVIVATHNPIVGKASMLGATLLQTKLALYTSYVVAGRAEPGRVPDALFWDTKTPYRYLRIDRNEGFDQIIYGGEDHKTGQESDAAARFATLESALEKLVPGITMTHRWSGQVIESVDGLPYIGETSPKQFVATGFCGNGITFGTMAGMIARDTVLGLKNPWAPLFDVSRKTLGAAWDYLKENADFPYYLIRDRFAGPEGKSTRAIPRGTGRILDLEGERVAAYRHSDGEVTLLSPTCTHLGCHVNWNDAEHTWDCPCHGSRFSATGDVLAGPAEKSLPPASRKLQETTPK